MRRPRPTDVSDGKPFRRLLIRSKGERLVMLFSSGYCGASCSCCSECALVEGSTRRKPGEAADGWPASPRSSGTISTVSFVDLAVKIAKCGREQIVLPDTRAIGS